MGMVGLRSYFGGSGGLGGFVGGEGMPSSSDRVPSNFTRNQHRSNLPTNFGIRVVPQQQVNIVERFGKFHAVLHSGIHFLIPLVDSIGYVHSLKEQTLDIPNQNAITRDNVAVTIDGILYVRIVDPYKASYGVEDPLYSVLQLAQTTMRSELGKISLDKTFEEREALNVKIVNQINEASSDWGIQCMRYEIRDIAPPQGVRKAMELQAEAERRKRAQILESEADKQSAINVAEGEKQRQILASEAAMQEVINKAMGKAESIEKVADATALGVERLARAAGATGSREAMTLRLAEQYIGAFSNLAKESNTVVIPSDAANPNAMLAQAMAVYKNFASANPQKPARPLTKRVDDTTGGQTPPGGSNNAGDATGATGKDQAPPPPPFSLQKK